VRMRWGWRRRGLGLFRVDGLVGWWVGGLVVVAVC
jgi:hypothetical protein